MIRETKHSCTHRHFHNFVFQIVNSVREMSQSQDALGLLQLGKIIVDILIALLLPPPLQLRTLPLLIQPTSLLLQHLHFKLCLTDQVTLQARSALAWVIVTMMISVKDLWFAFKGKLYVYESLGQSPSCLRCSNLTIYSSCASLQTRSGNEAVPGCTGSAPSGTDFCAVRATADTLWLKGDNWSPSENFPLGSCEGDCGK